MQSAIRGALEARLAIVAGIPATSKWAKENVIYEPEPGDTWLRVRLSMGARRLLTLPARQGWLRTEGVLRLMLHHPIGGGTLASDTLADAILAAFPVGLTLAASGGLDVRIDGGRVWSTAQADSEFTVPIDIYWHVLTTNPLN